MGIRYLAISIEMDDYLRISAGPCPTCGARPHARERDDEPEADILDLDKSWSHFHRFFESSGLHAAADLVAGGVTHTTTGWISHQGAIAPDRVPAVAADLAGVMVDQLRSHFRTGARWVDDRSKEHFEYVRSYLAAAVRFTAKAAEESRGIVYYIG